MRRVLVTGADGLLGGALLERHEGFFVDHPDWFQVNALEAFLVDLHEELHLPDPWGRILTGGLGLLAMSAAVSGLILHRHLIRDLFLTARPGGRLAAMRDRHLLAASWGLPFAFLLGFTGAFFGFGGPVLFPMIANVAFGGDRAALVAAAFSLAGAVFPRPPCGLVAAVVPVPGAAPWRAMFCSTHLARRAIRREVPVSRNS